ncbi:MAG: molybdopterin oxidoreductase, partial [Bacteroidales bacterium]|nr:molybdopterin oxidoreductase [Bacteroidales bacterium]
MQKAIPYLIKPEEITPGLANYYASTFFDGNDYCSILVKVRDGRPIKIEGNRMSSITSGGTNARTQASVLSLYDTARYQKPLINQKEADWEKVDNDIMSKLDTLRNENKPVYIISSSIISPSTITVLNRFRQKYQNVRLIQYDDVSYSGIIKANQTTFGKPVIPFYRFDNAKVIVSFGADFHGSWLLPVTFTKQYVKNRKLDEGQKTLSRHIQLEGAMSLTGSNADERIVISPSQEKIFLLDYF